MPDSSGPHLATTYLSARCRRHLAGRARLTRDEILRNAFALFAVVVLIVVVLVLQST